MPFPDVDTRDFLIPLTKCECITVGVVDANVVQKMRENDFDYAPLLSTAKTHVLGLVLRSRLEDLLKKDQELNERDEYIKRLFIPSRLSLDSLLEAMVKEDAAIVTEEYDSDGAFLAMSLGILTRSDLNKPPLRTYIYKMLAYLEKMLADFIDSSFEDPLEWLLRLNDDKQARLWGYWEMSKHQGADIGPLAAATVSELINIIACQKPLFKKLGYPSRNKFDDATGSITELRNAIMHPVRPLVTDANSVIKLKEVLETVLHLTQLLERPGFLLKKWGINLKERWNIHT